MVVDIQKLTYSHLKNDSGLSQPSSTADFCTVHVHVNPKLTIDGFTAYRDGYRTQLRPWHGFNDIAVARHTQEEDRKNGHDDI